MKFIPTKATLDYVIPQMDIDFDFAFPFGNIPLKRKETVEIYHPTKNNTNALW